MTNTLFIAAGTIEAKKIKGEVQPYLTINNKTNIERLVKAATQSPIVKKIYIWGEKKYLTHLLQKYLKQYPIHIVEQKNNIIESALYTWLLSFNNATANTALENWQSISHLPWQKLKQQIAEPWLNLLVCDTPFITSSDITQLLTNGIAQKKQGADFVFGRTHWQNFQQIIQQVGEKFNYKKAVKNYYTFHQNGQTQQYIVNSYFALNPLAFKQYDLQQMNNIIENRTIIKGNKRDWKKIRNNINIFTKYLKKHLRTRNIESIIYVIRAYRYIIGNQKTTVNKLNDLDRIYYHLEKLIGCKLRFATSTSFAAAFDIDTEYELDFCNKHYQEIKTILKNL